MNAPWLDLGNLDDLMDGGECRGVVVDGHKLGVFVVDEEVFVIDDLCSHGNALLSDGDLDGYEIECPLHAGAFDVRSGKALCKPLTRDVRKYETRVEAGALLVRFERT